MAGCSASRASSSPREAPPARRPAPASPAAPPSAADAPDARALAEGRADLEALRVALEGFEGVAALKAAARRCVFADGLPGARVMAVGEAPGREEDEQGRPFVGPSGQLLDRMLASIGLDRRAQAPDRAVYLANLSPWRPVRNRRPSGDEAAALIAFLERHIRLAAPDFVLALGGAAAGALLRTEQGILMLRGRWRRREGLPPILPTPHPAALLRNPLLKRQAWRDLLALRAALDGEPLPPEAAQG